jgi:hypothetical protein
MGKLWKWVSNLTTVDGIRSLLSSDAARGWLWSPLIALMSAFLGYLQGIPYLYTCLAAVLAFWATSAGLLSYARYLEMNSPEGRFTFVGIKGFRDNTFVRGKYKWKGFKPVLRLENNCSFPIFVRTINCSMSVESRISPDAMDLNFIAEVAPFSEIELLGGKIDLVGYTGNKLEGKISFEVEYGKSSLKLKHKKRWEMDMFLAFDNEGKNEMVSHYLTFDPANKAMYIQARAS